MRAIRAALNLDGTYLCSEIKAADTLEENAGPLGAYFYSTSVLYCMTVSLADGGMGLGTMWGEELALRMLADAGFVEVSVHRVPGDIVNNYYVATVA